MLPLVPLVWLAVGMWHGCLASLGYVDLGRGDGAARLWEMLLSFVDVREIRSCVLRCTFSLWCSWFELT